MPSELAWQELKSHYQNPLQQVRAARLGMWIFLGTEVLFFTGFFVAYTFYRSAYWKEFHEAGQHMKVLIGTVNTYVLITSSVFVALAVHFIRHNRRGAAALGLLAAALLGVGFDALKGYEYWEHVQEGALPGVWYHFALAPGPGAVTLYTLYWLMTGLHAVHVTVGIFVLGWLAFDTASGKFDAGYHTPVELGGMYWHFVDLVWVFLYPLLYLL